MKSIFFILSLAMFIGLCEVTRAQSDEKIKSDKPAENWYQSMPIGNGRIGAMIPGNVTDEIIGLNDDTFWSGEHRDLQKPETYKVLPEIRKLLLEGKDEEAAQKINASNLVGPRLMSYQPLGNLKLNFLYGNQAIVTDYQREIDLQTATVRTMYIMNEIKFERESFASFPDDVIVFTIKTDKPVINMDVRFETPHPTFANLCHTDGSSINVCGYAPMEKPGKTLADELIPSYDENKGIRFVASFRIVTDGTTADSQLTVGDVSVRNASTVRIYFTSKTSYIDPWTNPACSELDVKKLIAKNEVVLDNALQKSYEDLKKTHIADYQKYYNRVKLTVDNPAPFASQHSPLDLSMEQRLANYSPQTDPSLAALYYQFGRYLLISGSRPGTQPMNLQGIWNEDTRPAWGSKWTLNCNAEINYWGVETSNLSELHEPLIRMLKELTKDGEKTAKNMYNARGWQVHHNTDIWRTTWTVDGRGQYGFYQVGGAWLCHSAFDHYLFTGDIEYLAEIYPIMKGQVLFFFDILQEDNDGYLTTNPSLSFENWYKRTDGTNGWATYGAMQDIQIIRSLFRNTIEAAKTLNVDAGLQTEMQKVLNRLPPHKISPSRGDLQEWQADWEPANRNGQIPHGWALNPDWDISPVRTPELAAAFRKTLELRKPWEYSTASWVGSMAAGYAVKLFDATLFEMILDSHIRNNLTSAMISRFGREGGSWQNDGNLGMMAAIGESLLQSPPGEIRLLPALLPSWKSGSVSGLCARGGYTVDMEWTNGALTNAIIHAKYDRICCLCTQMPVIIFSAGKEIPVKTVAENCIEFEAKAGGEYIIKCR